MKPFPTHDSQDFWNASPVNSYVERRGEKVRVRKALKAQRRAERLAARGGTRPTGLADRTLSAIECGAIGEALPGDATSGWLVLFISRSTGRLEARWVASFWGALKASATVPGRVTRTVQVESVLSEVLDWQANAASGLL